MQSQSQSQCLMSFGRVALKRLMRGGAVAFSLILSVPALASIPVSVAPFSGADRSLSAAVSETLITDLARSPHLSVYDGRDARTASRARYSVVGSCVSLDGSVVINARVVDLRTGGTVPGCADRANGPRSGVLNLVGGMADRLANRLAGRFSPVARATSIGPRGRSSVLSGAAARGALSSIDAGSRLVARTAKEALRPALPVVKDPGPIPAVDAGNITPDGRDVELPRARYTGLIVDARGLGLERSMSPRIRFEDGSVLWAGANASPDFAIEHGIVAYTRSVREAERLERAGDNPLVIEAVARHADNFRSDPVLSAEDGKYLLEASRRDGFLKKFNVIFVID